MPSADHESSIAVAKSDPGLLARMLSTVFGIKVPAYHHVDGHPTEARVIVPRTYHADGMVVYRDAENRPLLAVVLEVQLRWDASKQFTWKLYASQLEAELKVNAALLVYCPKPALARRYRNLFATEGLSVKLRPFIFTPDDVPLVVDAEEARADPAMAVQALLCHKDSPGIDVAFPALAEMLRTVGSDLAILYYDIVLAGLPVAARVRWEAFVTTTAGYEFRSELFRKNFAAGKAAGKAEGKSEGKAQAVLTVLAARGVPISEANEARILACDDPTQLETWLQRAATATTVDEVIG